MSPSTFYGASRTSTTVVLDDDGRQVGRSVTTHDPEWDDRDRELALALEEELATRCGGCGLPLDETTDPDPYTKWQVDRDRVTTCRACAAHDDYVAGIDGDRRKHLHALQIPIGRTRLDAD